MTTQREELDRIADCIRPHMQKAYELGLKEGRASTPTSKGMEELAAVEVMAMAMRSTKLCGEMAAIDMATLAYRALMEATNGKRD